MNQTQRKQTKTVILSILLLVVIFILVKPFLPHSYALASNEDVEKGLKTLQDHQKALDQEAISSKIANATYQIELQIRKESGLPIDNKFLFRRCALLGDSMSSGLIDYRLLDPTNVFAQRGKRINNSEEEINAAIAFHPDHLFIQFGMNDVIYYRGDTVPFIADYEAMLDKIQAALPNVSIYVISIQPIQEKGLQSSPALRDYPGYNQAMKEMCERRNLTYLDVSALITPSSPYEFDGIHPKMPYYTDWVNLMIMAMEKKEAGA